MPQLCPLFPKAPGFRLKPSSAQQSLFSSWGGGEGEDASIPMLLSLLPLPPQASVGLSVLFWGAVLVSRDLVWRKSRAAGPFMGLLVSPNGEEGGQVYCLPELKAPLCPQLGLQGSGGQGCPPASASGEPQGSGFQGIAREAAQSQGS